MQIYKITNIIDNKIYIGKDTKSDSKYFGSGIIINRAIVKYGKENFIKEIIDETDDYFELSKKEIYWIKKYNSTDRQIGYNISSGGDGGDTLSNHPDLEIIKEKISKNSPKSGKTYEEVFGVEKSLIYKDKLKKTLHKSILSPELKERQKIKWQKFNDDFKNRCDFIKEEILIGKVNDHITELKLIKKRVSHNFLKNSEGFYKFFGEDLKYIFGKLKIREDETFSNLQILIKNEDIDGLISYLDNLPNRFFKKRIDFYDYIGQKLKSKIKVKLYELRKNVDAENSVPIIIDNIKYNSILEASKKLNIDRTKIRSRLKSSYFKNYLFIDNGLNHKFNKFIEIDPHLSKKEPISIDGIKYNSITEASNKINKPNDYITWRLNSKHYPEWVYLNKDVELIDTGIPKRKCVSVFDKIYESISEASRQTEIDRNVLKYRLKSKNFPTYFYI